LPRRHWWDARRAAAAAVLAVTIGFGAGWLARGTLWQHASDLDRLAQAGAELHRVAARGDVAKPIESDKRRLKLELSQALAHEVEIPDLEPMGLHLVGGRVLPIALGDAAAQLLYADDSGARFTLYLVRPDLGALPNFQSVAGDGVSGLVWAYEEFHCLLIGDAAPDRLLEISQAVQAQLDTDDSADG
jgi:anti-sigma factor RsiW